MAVEAFIDGFDGYSFSSILQKWTQMGQNVSFAVGGGRRLTTGLNLNSGGAGIAKTIPVSPTVTMGFAYRPSFFGTSSGAGICAGLAFFWGPSIPLVSIETRVDGHIYASRRPTGFGSRWGNGRVLFDGTSTDLGVRSLQPLQLNTWQYIEISITKAATAQGLGSLEVRVNGSTGGGIPATPIYTNNIWSSLNSSFYQVGIGTLSFNDGYYDGNGGGRFDDVYITYGDSQYWSCGDSRVDYLPLTVDSTPMDWVASDGRTYERYILLRDGTGTMSTQTAGATMMFEVQDLNYNPTAIHGVQVVGMGHKSDDGAKVVKLLIKNGDSTYETQAIGLGSGNTGLEGTAMTAPGGGAWTLSAVNSMRVGVTVVS